MKLLEIRPKYRDRRVVSRDDRVKRLLDISIAGLLALATLPLQVLLAVAVLLGEGRPIFFVQERAGLGGRPFPLVKFRTMSQDRDALGRLLPDAERLSGLGRLLRRSSLDELPELWSVLRGQMSIVGPRPLPVRYLPRYSPSEARRHEVRPGLTGLAQVSGRNALGWDERLALDVFYVDHRTLQLDIRILWRTLAVVVGGRGVGGQGLETMSEFRPDPSGSTLDANEVDDRRPSGMLG